MRKIFGLLLIAFALLNTNKVNAQAWSHDKKVLAIGFGGSNFIHFDPSGYYTRAAYFSRVTGQFNLQGEFGVGARDWFGLGFTTGIGGGGGWRAYYPEVNAPIGMIFNFHFYQLIEDKTSRDIRGDKLDIYAGVNIGTGVAAIFDNFNSVVTVHPLFFAGPQLGLRYWFSPSAGINFEAGWGKSWVNGGFVFNLGRRD